MLVGAGVCQVTSMINRVAEVEVSVVNIQHDFVVISDGYG